MTGAIDIYQDFLDRVTPRLLTGEIEEILPLLHLPFRMRTNDVDCACNTREAVRSQILSYCAHLEQTGVTSLRREAEVAKFRSATEIEGFHVTEIIRNGVKVVKPYASRILMRRIEGCWGATENDSVLRNTDWRLVTGAPAKERRPGPRA